MRNKFFSCIFLIFFLSLESLFAEVDFFFEPNLYSYQFIEKDLIQGYRNRNSAQVYRMGIDIDLENEFARVEVQASFVPPISLSKDSTKLNTNSQNQPSGSEQTSGFFLGRDAYVAFPIQDFTVNVGRKSFINQHPLSHKRFSELDGTEGLSLNVDVWKNIYWQITLWDNYRGYPIWEYNQTEVYGARDKADLRKGERSRHGTSFLMTSEFIDFTADFYYLNFGSWGRYSQDDLNLQNRESGDGDFYHRTRLGLVGKWEGFRASTKVHFARGLDKTFADPKRPERSLPIRGEALQLELGYFSKEIFFFVSGFVPNSMQTSTSDQATTIGYVGMGNSPLEGAYLSRLMNIYPSAWVTEFGLESIQENKGRRSSSFLGKWGAGYFWEPFQISLFVETLIPRLLQAEDRGEISLRKMDYSKQSFSEFTGRFEYLQSTLSTKIRLGIELSYLWTTKEVEIQGTGVRVYGGFQF